MNILIKNIKELVQVEDNPKTKVAGKDMAKIETIENAFLYLKNGLIEDFGPMENSPSCIAKVIDATGKYVLPSYVDSHSHLIYSGSREKEFVMRIKGASYEDIAREGGGILNSANRLRETSEDHLFRRAKKRLFEVMSMGTGALEIKSGYGLSTESELKMLRVIKKLKAISPITLKSTFLGAHAIPAEYKDRREDYVKLITDEMLPQIAEEELADYIDVFCDRGFFTYDETDIILQAGAKYGLKAKVHANELDFSGGVQVGVKNNAISVDHLEHVGDEEINLLLNSETMPTLLPSTAFYLNLIYPPARKMIDAGLPVALASDFNPGSSPSGNMNLVWSLACIKLKMLPEEALNAATINSAYAMELQQTHGSIARGKIANVFITQKLPSYSFIPYSFGSNFIELVILKGKVIDDFNYLNV